MNHGSIWWHKSFEWMLPDLRSVYSYIPYNTNNFIVLTMYLSIPLYEKLIQLQYNSFSCDMPWWSNFHWICHCNIYCDIVPNLTVFPDIGGMYDTMPRALGPTLGP